MPQTWNARLWTALLTLAVASPAAAQRESGPTQRDTAFTWSKRIPDGGRLAIRNLNGGIEVRPGSTDQVEIRAVIRTDSPNRVSDVTFDVREHAPDNIEICTASRGYNACVLEERWGDNYTSVRFIVDLPRGLRFQGITGRGDVIVMQVVNEADVNTGNGDVVIRESLGRAAVTTGSGSVTVAMANGPVGASSGNGRVLVNTWRGPVDASSGNGDVDVRMISVGPVQGPQSMTISSGNGDVRLTLPADFSGEIDATTGHGDIKSDFIVRSTSRNNDSRLRGTIGSGGGLTIRLRSGNGRLEIRKD